MKTIKMLRLKNISVGAAMFILILASCQKDNDILNSLDVQNVNSEAASSAYVNENSDISSGVIGSLTTAQYSGARMEGDIIPNPGDRDGRLKCATVTVNRTGTKDAPAGTITIDFGTTGSCADNHGVIRKGKIIITYSGRRWMPGSTFSIQFVDFYRNSNHIEGKESDTTKLSADSLHLKFVSWLVGGKITFGDGKTIERNHTLSKTWYRSSLPQNDEWHLEGNAYGKNKNGNVYTMEIQSALIHKVSCWVSNKVTIPVKGVKIITVTTASGVTNYKVDYGDGTCDNQVTVTINGKEKVITVKEDGN
ncbi:MAG: hypothetical protein HY015_08860 [Bacteroidetes bacterium]|nr:hypothetical protein [Bacteroidota bacterium]MBI3483065.1 hypothetical protein [Bacteroidota bacterium]